MYLHTTATAQRIAEMWEDGAQQQFPNIDEGQPRQN